MPFWFYRADRQTDRIADADDRYTDATTVGVSNELEKSEIQSRVREVSPVLLYRSDIGVNLYTWNRVSVYRVNQLGGLSVNGGRPVKGHSTGQLMELNLPMTIYVGGYPASYNRQAGISSGFHGAIQRVRLYRVDYFDGDDCDRDKMMMMMMMIMMIMTMIMMIVNRVTRSIECTHTLATRSRW